MNVTPIKKLGERKDIYGKLLSITKCTICANIPHTIIDEGKFSNSHKHT